MCPEERRRRNINTCCVSLEIAMADMMYFFFFFLLRGSFVSVFLWRGSCVSVFLWSCVSFSFVFLCFFFFFWEGSDSKGTVRSGLITVLKTVRLNRDSNGSLLFGHRPVLEHKKP